MEEEELWPWDQTVVGVVTNSDDRVPSILSSLGLTVGARTVRRPEQMSQENTRFQPARSEDIADIIPTGSLALRHLDTSARTGEDIHFVILSYDVGDEKPNSRIFQAAKDMLGFTLQDDNGSHQDIALGTTGGEAATPGIEESTDDFVLLHIGDDVQKDVIGAQKAGFQSILLDREGRYSQTFEESKNRILSVPIRDGDASTSHEMQVIQDLRDLRYWLV
ncbi:MAG: hypothetical protein M1839_006215 [Geoglossum umbratile]|nr:MAG: hypothetical protein M1839_006215 [Geoglossum umbratile]